MDTVRFKVSSTDPRVTSDELAEALAEDGVQLELSEHLRQKFKKPGLKTEGERETSVPIDPGTAILIIKVIAGAIAAGFLEEVGAEIFRFLKKKISNGSVDPDNPPPKKT